MTATGPYRTPAEVPKICVLVDPGTGNACTDKVKPGHEFCCWHEYELYAIGESWKGCGDPKCNCWC